MGFYSLSPLTPGGWLSLLDDAGLPHTMRRLPLTVEAGGERAVEARCLNMLPALAYLLAQPHDREESGSVRAWRLAAAGRANRGAGGEPPDLSRFASAFPPLASALIESGEERHAVEATDRGRELRAGGPARAGCGRARAAAAGRSRRVRRVRLDLTPLEPALRVVAPPPRRPPAG